MFLQVPSDRAGYNKAVISPDNLCIEWPANQAEPNWREVWMARYHEDFERAMQDCGADMSFLSEPSYVAAIESYKLSLVVEE